MKETDIQLNITILKIRIFLFKYILCMEKNVNQLFHTTFQEKVNTNFYYFELILRAIGLVKLIIHCFSI